MKAKDYIIIGLVVLFLIQMGFFSVGNSVKKNVDSQLKELQYKQSQLESQMKRLAVEVGNEETTQDSLTVHRGKVSKKIETLRNDLKNIDSDSIPMDSVIKYLSEY